MAGPLAGVKVLEFAGIGPGPFCAMLLSDMGAEVVRIDRPDGGSMPNPVMDRGRRSLTLDLKAPADHALILEAIGAADVLIEGLRPGVMERLGLGPDVALAKNPKLIYGRMTGWGQEGPLSRAAGHDINYIALTGALAGIGPKDGPSVPPLNLIGDFGGGSMYLAFGIVAALYERDRSGKGQVIDAAIVDGVAHLMAMFSGQPKRLPLERDRSMLGGAAPFYRCYTCKDGKDVAVGAIEPKFYAELIQRIGAEPGLTTAQNDKATWASLSDDFAALFATKTQAEWVAILEGTDACFAPVLTLAEAPSHNHMAARGVYEERDGLSHPIPAPRLSRTPGSIQDGSADGRAALAAWGVK